MKEIFHEKKAKKEALNVSIKEGSATAFSGAISETYITPFALVLRANSIHIGILSAISGLINPLAQIYGNRLMENHKRKKIARTFILLQTLIWIPIIILAYLLFKGIESHYFLVLLIIFYALFAAFSGVVHPAWFSWMGDLVSEKHRGVYFSKRNRIMGIWSLVTVILAALLLDLFKTRGYVLIGFLALFSLAILGRFTSFLIMKKQYEPEFKLDKGYYFSFWSFLKRFDNYGKFAVFHALFNFALMIASPFFSVYMLTELKFSYITFMAVTMSSSVFYILFTPIVGRFSDKYGNKKLFLLGCTLFSLNPLLWIFIKNPLGLIFFPQVIVGLANASLVLAVTNFTYDAANEQHRALCTSYTNILAGIGIFIGSLIGGFLIKYAGIFALGSFMVVFGISSIARFFVSFVFISKIKEERKVSRLPPMHVKLVHPFKALHAEIGWIRKVIKK